MAKLTDLHEGQKVNINGTSRIVTVLEIEPKTERIKVSENGTHYWTDAKLLKVIEKVTFWLKIIDGIISLFTRKSLKLK